MVGLVDETYVVPRLHYVDQVLVMADSYLGCVKLYCAHFQGVSSMKNH